MRLCLALAVGVVVVSFAAIFIRLAEAPALVIAAYRLTLASLIIAPAGLVRSWQEIKDLDRKDCLYAVVSGLFLTLHFGFWIASLNYTTVASSVVFVSTHPLFVGVASHFLTKDRLTAFLLGGIIVAVLGGMTIGWDDLALGWTALRGDFLALMGGASAAGYFLVGRRLRLKISVLAYISLAYSVAAVGTLALCALSRQPFTGYSAQTYLMFVLLAVGPQLIVEPTGSPRIVTATTEADR